MLAVSDGVADLLGLGVVEIMGSQLTDMVTHISSKQHPCENPLQELFWFFCSSDPRSLPKHGTSNRISNQVHPCDHNLLRELFQPGRDIRQIVVRARCQFLYECVDLQRLNPAFAIWILPIKQNKTSHWVCQDIGFQPSVKGFLFLSYNLQKVFFLFIICKRFFL